MQIERSLINIAGIITKFKAYGRISALFQSSEPLGCAVNSPFFLWTFILLFCFGTSIVDRDLCNPLASCSAWAFGFGKLWLVQALHWMDLTLSMNMSSTGIICRCYLKIFLRELRPTVYLQAFLYTHPQTSNHLNHSIFAA